MSALSVLEVSPTSVGDEAAVDEAMAGGVEPLIALHPEAQGRGLATDAIGALCHHAKLRCGLMRLVAAVDEPNHDSHRLMRRSGFREIGRGTGPKHELLFYARAL